MPSRSASPALRRTFAALGLLALLLALRPWRALDPGSEPVGPVPVDSQDSADRDGPDLVSGVVEPVRDRERGPRPAPEAGRSTAVFHDPLETDPDPHPVLRLHVRWANGEPAAGFRVCRPPRHPGDTWAEVGETDGQGRCDVRAWVEGALGIGLAHEPIALALNMGSYFPGPDVQDLVVPSDLRGLPWDGRVVDSGGAPVAGARVDLRGAHGAPTLRGDRLARTDTDAGGRFAFESLSPAARLVVRETDATFERDLPAREVLDGRDLVVQRKVLLRLHRAPATPHQLWLTLLDADDAEQVWQGPRNWAGAAQVGGDVLEIRIPEAARHLRVRYGIQDVPHEFPLQPTPDAPLDLFLP